MMSEMDWDAMIGEDLRRHGVARARRTIERYAEWRDDRLTTGEVIAALVLAVR